jgi:prepilin-type N-terminal cleavage/methylation domain-containing protein
MKTTHHFLRDRNGFTLVELLVVITIIVALAALGLGVMSKMRQRADSVKQISIVRQIGPLMTMHAGDNNGYLPASYSKLTRLHWHQALHVLMSPEFTVDQVKGDTYWKSRNPLIKNPLYKKPVDNLDPKSPWVPGYGINTKLVDNTKTAVDYANGEWQGNARVSLSKIGNLAKTPLVAPAPDYHYSTIKTNDPRMEQFIVNKQIPILFADGHIESMPPRDYEARKLHLMPQ